ncbi:hypothetical protein AMS68_007963 [Peltaster fructicola]|uniref:Uncharacterized protein n=1 Tax=Peltaster fructicola TaxID=286661 RepID=A0A6H0Y628_9PEZI|nr:hypothetical protein AMS68_007963 [Peltaster fructicola]
MPAQDDSLYLTMAILNILCYRQAPDRPERKGWHLFIDQLCHMCDHESDAKSVCCNAGVKKEGALVLLFATRAKDPDESVQHLQWLLSVLRPVSGMSSDRRLKLLREIQDKCLARSTERISNYKDNLRKRISRTSEVTPADPELTDDLSTCLDQKQTNTELCQWAYDFKETALGQRLSSHCAQSVHAQPWLEVQHYIGRLRSWHRAARILVNLSARLGNLLNDITVALIPLPTLPLGKGSRKDPPASPPDLGSTLEMICQGLSVEQVKQKLRQALTEHKESEQKLDLESLINKIFKRRATTYDVHPEVAMADYIQRHGLRFLDRYRYIGCSKPSCYCCSLYLREHPLRLATRPSHNRVWMRWCYPLCPEDQNEDERRRWDIQRLRFGRKMAAETKRCLLREGRARGWLRDSTTGRTVGSTLLEGLLLTELGDLRINAER